MFQSLFSWKYHCDASYSEAEVEAKMFQSLFSWKYHCDSLQARRNKSIKGVSILVFLEVPLWRDWRETTKRRKKVSILVFLEVPLWPRIFNISFIFSVLTQFDSASFSTFFLVFVGEITHFHVALHVFFVQICHLFNMLLSKSRFCQINYTHAWGRITAIAANFSVSNVDFQISDLGFRHGPLHLKKHGQHLIGNQVPVKGVPGGLHFLEVLLAHWENIQGIRLLVNDFFTLEVQPGVMKIILNQDKFFSPFWSTFCSGA